ncbi:MAG: GNAT family N-acetyltransferase [Firmicutes bacterium]|nr:GNAT family N-acetyltransferase [Bacillota bacterium]
MPTKARALSQPVRATLSPGTVSQPQKGRQAAVTLAAHTRTPSPARKRRPSSPTGRRPARSRARRGQVTANETSQHRTAPEQAPVAPSSEAPVSSLFLRPMLPQDEPAIGRWTTEEIAPIFREAYGYDLDLAMVMEYLRSADTRIILVGDRPCGYLASATDDTGKMNVGSLVLTKEEQGKGYGTRIMRQVEREARAAGVRELEVFIQSNNARSQAFAKSLGFSEVPSNQPNTVIMTKSLA